MPVGGIFYINTDNFPESFCEKQNENMDVTLNLSGKCFPV